MGASLYYRPVKPVDGSHFASGSTLHGYMVNAFGEFPVQLSTEDIPTLNGMVSCGYHDLQDLIAAIIKHKVVEITVDY